MSQAIYANEFGAEHYILKTLGGRNLVRFSPAGMEFYPDALGISATPGVTDAPGIGLVGVDLSPVIHMGDAPAIASTSGVDSTPVITETYIQAFWTRYNTLFTGVGLFNGSNVTGNVLVGLADANGIPIPGVVSASTAGSGTDAYQRVPFGKTFKAPGPRKYHLMVQYSSATARYNTHAVGGHPALVATGQTFGTLASFTPPSTFVANVANLAYIY